MTLEDLKAKKILVVDDEPDLREIMRDSLESEGAEVTEAENGSEAFKKIQSNQFDAVVSDIRMPGGDGMTLAKNIMSLPGEKPIVVLVTGFSDVSPSEAYDIGIQKFLIKPFKLDVLVAKLKLSFSTEEVRWAQELHATIKDLAISGEVNLLLKEKKIRLGSGGIFIEGSFSECRNGDFVRIHLENNIVITGVIRWINMDPSKSSVSGVGIEFINLSEPARKYFKEKIAEIKPQAFIPKG